MGETMKKNESKSRKKLLSCIMLSIAFMLISSNAFALTPNKVTTYNDESGVYGSGDGTIPAGEGRRCLAFTSNRGVLLAEADQYKGRISEIAEKHYSNQVYASVDFGVTRMEEEQVVEVICWEE